MVDTEKSSWRKLLSEFEEEGHGDVCINGHELSKGGGVDQEGGTESLIHQPML